ncbi:MAG: alpha/beta hydrolase [Anaerolineae bacterium]|jgi:pimeloyl-ACP methyl ester carboxylesterase|nr:alpha/beta hydrolase [Anaerolineae bacterium]MBT7073003.1 alpha/beta hydrolase [Anaerolineae bacterium]MBT7325283.1 alpha/beta hydrolase [Anaerolineae bacterium]
MPTADGLYYFSHEADDPARPPILLIHGAGGSHLHWSPEIRRLNGFQIVSLDLPGHGKSEGIGRQTITDYVQAVQKFMDAINMPAAIIIGHSMGSAIALQLVLDAPDRVLALVIIGSGSRLRVAPSILESASNPATFPLAVKNITEWSFGPETSPRLKELAAQRMEKETRPPVLHGDFLACNEFDSEERLPEIKTPTLILCGTEDKMTPLKYSQALHEKIKDSEFIEIEGAGHMVMLEKPREVAEAIEYFIDRL